MLAAGASALLDEQLVGDSMGGQAAPKKESAQA
jgi:hypothetical protein